MIKKYCLCLLLSFWYLGLQANEALDYEFKGRHFIASYLGCDTSALSNVEELKEAFLAAVNESGATQLAVTEHVFPPDGLTMLVLLSESHASIHTYPEYNACFVDLFTCGTKCQAECFDEALRKYLKPKEVHFNLLSRGELGVE